MTVKSLATGVAAVAAIGAAAAGVTSVAAGGVPTNTGPQARVPVNASKAYSLLVSVATYTRLFQTSG